MEAIADFRLLRPASLAGVLEARAAYPDSQLLGGGTDLLVNVRRGIVAPSMLIDMTGVVTVDKVWVAHDCGKALNRLSVEGQVQGSVWMGMGQAMSEEAGYHDGLMVTANMLDYRVPTIQDSPHIEVGIVESNDPHGPFGAKEAGEGSLAAFLPALTNAIADAIGVRFNDLPVTPDRVFAAIEKMRRKGNGHQQ